MLIYPACLGANASSHFSKSYLLTQNVRDGELSAHISPLNIVQFSKQCAVLHSGHKDHVTVQD